MAAQTALETALVSPHIASLEQALASGESAALAAFWQEISEHGAPLIEPIEADDTHSFLPFLWRGLLKLIGSEQK